MGRACNVQVCQRIFSSLVLLIRYLMSRFLIRYLMSLFFSSIFSYFSGTAVFNWPLVLCLVRVSEYR